MDRRTALAALGLAGLGLFAAQLNPVRAAESKGSAPDGLEKLSVDSRNRLRELIRGPDFDGRIPAEEVRQLAKADRKSADELMLALLPLAQTYARPPLSGFRAGAVAGGASGDLYLGANLEIPGHALSLTVHGEQAALANAYMHGETSVTAVAASDAPCGYCRQFMYDLAPSGDLRILVEGNPPTQLSSLLPAAFGPADLGMKEGAFPVKTVALELLNAGEDTLSAAALDAARKSYAPYTKAYSGIAIATRRGRIYRGAYLENAAFNPSLSPLQTALVALILAGENFSAITRVCLVEVRGASISQQSVTEAALGTVAPAVKLQIVTATTKA